MQGQTVIYTGHEKYYFLRVMQFWNEPAMSLSDLRIVGIHIA